jgi:hypothetical protein
LVIGGHRPRPSKTQNHVAFEDGGYVAAIRAKSAAFDQLDNTRQLPTETSWAKIRCVMAEDRFFLDRNGAATRRIQGQPGGGHYEIGQEQLAQNGIVPTDFEDVYRQMFRLKFVRVVVNDGNSTVEVEYGPDLTAAQETALEEFRRSGKEIVRTRARLV